MAPAVNQEHDQLLRLCRAIAKENYKRVRHILRKGVNMEVIPPGVSHPLNLAIDAGEPDIVDLLIKYGASVEGASDTVNPLQQAIILGKRNIVDLLLQRGANIEGNQDNATPLLTAILNRQHEIIKLLLEKGASADGHLNQESPLLFAIRKGDCDIVRLLLENSASVNGKDETDHVGFLAFAIEGAHHDIVDLLLRSGFNLNNDISYVYFLIVAARGSDVRLIKTLLTHGAQLCGDQLLKGNNPRKPHQLIQHPEIIFQHLLGRCFCNPEFMEASVSEQLSTGEEGKGDCHHPANVPNYVHHLIKIIAANVHPTDEEFLDEINDIWRLAGEDWKSFRSECLSQVTEMKKLTISSTNLTFFDFLIKDTYQVARCARNRKVVETLNSEELNCKFPKFSAILKCQFQMGCQRIRAVEKGVKILCSVSTQFEKLPQEIKEIILNHLSLQELLIFTNACPTTS